MNLFYANRIHNYTYTNIIFPQAIDASSLSSVEQNIWKLVIFDILSCCVLLPVLFPPSYVLHIKLS